MNSSPSHRQSDATAAELFRAVRRILIRLQLIHTLSHALKAGVVWILMACLIRGRMGWGLVHLISVASFVVMFLMDIPNRRVALRRLESLRPDSDFRFTTLFDRAGSSASLASGPLEKLLLQIHDLLRSPVSYISAPGFAFSFRAFSAAAAAALLWSMYSPAAQLATTRLPPILRVKPPAAPVRSGVDVPIHVYSEGRMAQPVLLVSMSAAGRGTAIPEEIPLIQSSVGIFEATLRRVNHPLTLTAVAGLPNGGTVRSPDVRLSVLRAPILAVRSIWITPPAYTGLAAEEKRSGAGGIHALPGAEITVRIESDVDIGSAALDAGRDVLRHYKLKHRGREIEVHGNVLAPATLSVTATSHDGLPADPGVSLKIDTDIDRAPGVSWLLPKQTTVDAPAEGLVPMRWQVDDDFGLSAFHISVTTSSGETKRIAAPILPAPRQTVSHLLEITPYLSYAGSEIEVAGEAMDNDKIGGPKLGRSTSIRIKAPTVMDVYRRLAEQGGEVSRVMERMSGESTRLLKKMAAAARTMKADGKIAWQMEQELVSMAESARQAKADAEQALAELGKRAEAASRQNLLSHESLQKLSAIGAMMSSLLRDQYVQAQRELERAIGSVRMDEKERALMSSKFNMEQFVEQIDRTHRMLERMTDILAQSEARKAVQDLVEQTQKAFSDKNADQLQSLAKNAQSLMPKLQELAKDPAFSELKKALAAAADVPKQFDQAAKSMRESAASQSEQTEQQAKAAEERLQKALADIKSGLQKGAEKSESQEKQNAADKLGSTVDGLVFTLGEMEWSYEYFLSARSRRMPDEYSKHLQKSSAFEQILTHLISEVTATAERLILFDPRPIQLLGRAVSSLHAIPDQDEDASAVANRIKAAYRYSATAALYLSDIAQEMKQQGGGTPKGNPMQSLADLLQQMISAQGTLNSQTQMSLQMGQFGQNMEQLAYQQELIRRSMEAESGRFSELQEKLGRVDKMLEEMRKVEDDLRRTGPTAAVQEKQQKILNKLMELQQSMTDKEEKEDKFEAEPFFGKATETSVLNVDRPKIDEAEFLRGLPTELRDIGRRYIRSIMVSPP